MYGRLPTRMSITTHKPGACGDEKMVSYRWPSHYVGLGPLGKQPGLSTTGLSLQSQFVVYFFQEYIKYFSQKNIYVLEEIVQSNYAIAKS